MKRTIYESYKNYDCLEIEKEFGDGNIAIVKIDGKIAIFDKSNFSYITPLLSGKYGFIKENYVYIVDNNKKGFFYDFVKKKIIAYNVEVLFQDYRGNVVYYDKKTKKYYIKDLFNGEEISFDYLKIILCWTSDLKQTWFMVQNDKGKGLYCGMKCIIPNGTAKEINLKGNIFFVTALDGKQSFVFNEKKSEEFDNIKLYEKFIVCQKGNITYCYQGNELLFKVECDELVPTKCSTVHYDELLDFIIKKEGKYGIIQCTCSTISGKCSSQTPKIILPFKYDKIEFEYITNNKAFYYLYEGKNVGLYSDSIINKKNIDNPFLIEPQYKSIKNLNDNVFLFTNFYGNKKIVDVQGMTELVNNLVNNIDSVDSVEYGHIIYTKCNKKGYIYHGKPIIYPLDEIREIGKMNLHTYYEIRRGSLNGLIMDGEIMIPIKDNQFITFFNDCPIFAIYDEEGTHICKYNCLNDKGYDEIYKIPSKIDEVCYCKKNKNGSYIFCIDGTYYEYNYPYFKKSMMYYALYEFENGSLFSATSDKAIHEGFIKAIECTPETTIEKKLIYLNNRNEK